MQKNKTIIEFDKNRFFVFYKRLVCCSFKKTAFQNFNLIYEHVFKNF